MSPQRLLIIAGGVLVIGVGIYGAIHFTPASLKKTDAVLARETLTENLSGFSSTLLVDDSYFIDDREQEGVPLPPNLKKIKDSAIGVLLAAEPGNEEYYSQAMLHIVDPKYVLLRQATVRGTYDIIINAATGEILNGLHPSFETTRIIVYIQDRRIDVHLVSWPWFEPLAGSELPEGETYHDGQSDFALSPQETHTNDWLTIAVFDSTNYVLNPTNPQGIGHFTKIREAGYMLP